MHNKVSTLTITPVIFAVSCFALSISQETRITVGDITLHGNVTLTTGGLVLDEESRVIFKPGSIVRGSLGSSRLQNCKLVGLDMQQVDFQSADISGADFLGPTSMARILSKRW